MPFLSSLSLLEEAFWRKCPWILGGKSYCCISEFCGALSPRWHFQATYGHPLWACLLTMHEGFSIQPSALAGSSYPCALSSLMLATCTSGLDLCEPGACLMEGCTSVPMEDGCRKLSLVRTAWSLQSEI